MESPSSVQIDTQCEEKLELTGYEDVTCAAKIFNYGKNQYFHFYKKNQL